jgi:hypothetical protein
VNSVRGVQLRLLQGWIEGDKVVELREGVMISCDGHFGGFLVSFGDARKW